MFVELKNGGQKKKTGKMGHGLKKRLV